MERWIRVCAAAVVGLLVFVGLGMSRPMPVRGAPITVTNCASSGMGSLAGAIASTVAGDTIGFTPGLNCSVTGAGAIIVTSTLAIAQSLTIDGIGATIVVDGGCTGCEPGGLPSGGVGVFDVTGSGAVTFGNLTIQHGHTATFRSAIHIGGTAPVTVHDTVLTANATGNGGAIFVSPGGSTVTVHDSLFAGNSATTGNGGAISSLGTLTVTGSSFAGNRAAAVGGALDLQLQPGDNANVSNSTFANNTAGAAGGALSVRGTTTLTNVTIAGNTGGGGIIAGSAGVTLTNTIVANNTDGDLNPATPTAPPTFHGSHNLIGDAASGGDFTDGANDNIVGHPALLGTLGNNGGPTLTIPLLTGSVAIGHGDPTACAAIGIGKVNGTDQRGLARPAMLCAIGAFEPLLSVINPSSGAITGGTAVTLAGAGYAAGATVSIGGVACTNVQVVSSTTLTCATGAHAAGLVNIVVTVGSTTGTLNGRYTYGVLAPLPGAKPSVAPIGLPVALPGSRASGTADGTAPNPLPSLRP